MSDNTKSLVQLLMEAGYTNVDVMTQGKIVKGKDYLEEEKLRASKKDNNNGKTKKYNG